MRNGMMTKSELITVLKILKSDYERFVEAGMPYDKDDSGILWHNLEECNAWIEDNTEGFNSDNYAKIKTVEEAEVVKAITQPGTSDYETDLVMINDCECLVKTKDRISTVKIVVEVDVPEDEVQDFANAMSTTIYQYQEVML